MPVTSFACLASTVSRIVSLIFRRKFPRLKLVFLSMEQVFLKPCSEMTIISHLSAKSIADHYFKCTQTSWAVCTCPPGVQLWVRINSDYRWTTDLTLINLPPDFHLKKKMQVEIWPMNKNKLQYFLLGGYSVFCLLADSANMAEPQTDDSPRRRQTHTSASCPWTFLCVRIRSFVSSIHQNLGRCL